MKSFGDWFRDLGKSEEALVVVAGVELKGSCEGDTITVDMLPEGVWEYETGKYKAECVCCHQDYELGCDLKDFDPNYSYCGGSPRCCP